MAQPEESFKVCGLCSQLVDEAVKLTDILLDFLTKFLNVEGSNLPLKICTECYQSAIDSKKFKEKCLRTVEKLKKTHISSTMILGRSSQEVKHMKNKFKNGLDLGGNVDKDITDQIEQVGVIQDEHKPLNGEETENLLRETCSGRSRAGRRTVSRNSSLGSNLDDTPLSTRSRRTAVGKTSIQSLTEMYGAHMQPKIRISEAERKIADDMLADDMLVERSRSGRPLKRKVASPEDPVPLDFLTGKKVKTEPGPDTFPYRPRNTHPGRPRSKTPKGYKYKGYAIIEEPDPKDSDTYDLDDGEEEIFPSLGPYQCEICQEITDTKQEFVAHIKALHKDMVDEAVLRSLESDLKKRKKKEMAASPDSKKVPRPGKSEPFASVIPKQSEKLKPRPRPIKRYVEDESDDEYKPNRSKRVSKKKSPGKIEIDNLALKAELNKPGICPICGVSLARSGDIPKHQESLKCRQAAFNLAQERHKKAKEEQRFQEEDIKDESVDAEKEKGENKPTVIQDKVDEIDKNDVDAIANKVLEDTFGATASKELDSYDSSLKEVETYGTSSVKEFGSSTSGSGPSDSDDVAHNVPNDTKFKASIAKRYEAERNDSCDSKDSKKEVRKKDQGNTDEYELEDFDGAIKAAMQESIETAQKELGQTTGKISTPLTKTSSPVVGDHSPAAYIDPAPQPDVEPYRDPNKSSVIVPNMSKHGITGKEWSDNCREPTTVDLGALGEPTSLNAQPHSQENLDSLESQMAALHGAEGAHTPWQEFNEYYSGHKFGN